ncbi:aminotransferase class V-fold PLP-dependent enzyme [Pseudoalteromonas fenneropenaei]|uniref:Cysteine desulfurase n=1 Tax=Pseudoalteromonas fenneropenaei TaxID=1737459 RepID=A0ABV7CHS2_9GAMM
MLDLTALRSHFPMLSATAHGEPLVYFDNGATSQKPVCVIDTEALFYRECNANVHRGVHYFSAEATRRYEQSREVLADFLAVESREIVWTKGATEALNLLAHGLTHTLCKGDIILISELEHHANIVPWQLAAARTGAELKAILVNSQGILELDTALALIARYKPKVLALCHASNGLGNIHDISTLIAAAKRHGAICVVDGAQALLHLQPKPKALGCDFYVASAHKALGPTGVGFLYGRYELLNALPPYQGGGEMIETVTIAASTYREAPGKFEAGTPNIAGVIAFAEALKFIQAQNAEALRTHEQALYRYLVTHLTQIDGITLYGDLSQNIGTVSFNFRDEHPFDIATLLDHQGIAVRTGHHCNQPLMQALNISGTIRVSLAFYNTFAEVDCFINALNAALALLAE